MLNTLVFVCSLIDSPPKGGGGGGFSVFKLTRLRSLAFAGKIRSLSRTFSRLESHTLVLKQSKQSEAVLSSMCRDCDAAQNTIISQKNNHNHFSIETI